MLAGTIGSRPVGTEANARARAYIIDQLRLFGFEVRVQEADARRASLGRSARVSNIIAVRAGAPLRSRRPGLALRLGADGTWRGRRCARRGGVARSRAGAGGAAQSQLVADGARHRRRGGRPDGRGGADDRPRRHQPAAGVHQLRVDRVGRHADALRGRPGKRLAARAVGAVARRIRAAARSSPRSTSGCRTTPTSRSSSCRRFPGSTSPPSATATPYHTSRDTVGAAGAGDGATRRRAGRRHRDGARRHRRHRSERRKSAPTSTSPRRRRSPTDRWPLPSSPSRRSCSASSRG